MPGLIETNYGKACLCHALKAMDTAIGASRRGEPATTNARSRYTRPLAARAVLIVPTLRAAFIARLESVTAIIRNGEVGSQLPHITSFRWLPVACTADAITAAQARGS